MDYLRKYDDNPYSDLLWNVPERHLGTVNVIGGNSSNFRTPVKVAESMAHSYPVKTVNLVFPDSLRAKLPPLDNVIYLSSTDSGSLSSADELSQIMNSADYNLIIGDLSRNSITEAAISGACLSSDAPVIINRDAVDLIAPSASPALFMNEKLTFLATIPQLQKIFHALYYPKVLMASQSLLQVADAIHKFTLSYPVQIITLHNSEIIIAKNGNIHLVPLDKTKFTPLSFWFGEAANCILIVNLFNPNNFEQATVAALMS